MKLSRKMCVVFMVLFISTLGATAFGADKPNILVIWGDGVGQSNISAYTMRLVGYRTPNIDRIAKEGVIFTDYYGEQSCTAGRASFMLGQSVFRTGLSKVELPGAKESISSLIPPSPCC
jgi:arylsulfatase A-like enzyme